MATAPDHDRAPGLALPWLPLPVILGFSLLGAGGALILTYTTFSYADVKRPMEPSNYTKVYEARAVPFEARRADPMQREAITRALTATPPDVQKGNDAPENPSHVLGPTLLADSSRELAGFRGFTDFVGANSYLAVTGTSFGISAQSAPSNFAGADAETLTSAPVPEASTWMCGGALLVLVGARGVRAQLRRRRRRAGQ